MRASNSLSEIFMKYETGSRESVIAELVRCAIQDRDALICAHKTQDPMTGEFVLMDEDDRETVEQCEAAIRDFQRIGDVLK